MSSDGAEDVTIAINSSPNKLIGPHVNSSQLFTTIGGGILCAKASMLLQVCTLIHLVLATIMHLFDVV
jgi:homeobox-leucine zipper protein